MACPLRAKSGHRAVSFDHLIGTSMKRSGNIDVLFPGRLKIDYELKDRGLHDRKLRRVGTIENFSGIDARLAIRIWDVRPITHQPTHLRKLPEWVDRRERQLTSSCDNRCTLSEEKGIPTQ